MSRKNLSYSPISVIDSREGHKRSQLAKIRRDVFIKENSKTNPKLVSTALLICRQGNKYFLDISETWLSSNQRALDEFQIESLKFNQYLESLKSLLHNLNFIISAKNFGSLTKNGEIIDVNYLKSTNFSYDTNLRSIYGCKTKFRPITDKNKLLEKLISILNSSIEIVKNLEQEIDIDMLKQVNPEFEIKLLKYQSTQKKLFEMAENLIVSLKNNTVNLDAFYKSISFEDKKTSHFNYFLN